MRWLPAALPVLAAAALVPSAASTPASRTATVDLGTLGGQNSKALAVDDRGEIIGQSQTSFRAPRIRHAFEWSRGHLRDLGTLPGDTSSEAVAINAAGTIVGASGEWANNSILGRPVMWRGGMIRALPGVSDGEAIAINAHGVIVGQASETSGAHAIVWVNGRTIDLNAFFTGRRFGRGFDAYANGVDDAGDVLVTIQSDTRSGSFIWRRGHITELRPLPGDSETEVYAMNRHGDVTGYSGGADSSRAVIWRGGRVTRIGRFPGMTYGEGTLIADDDTVAGDSGDGTNDRSFLWRGGTMVDLGEPAVTAMSSSGELAGARPSRTASGSTFAVVWADGAWKGLSARDSMPAAINRLGEIVGWSRAASGAGVHATAWVGR